MERKAGILMHITSLPSKYGNGTLGKEAYRFVDFLAASGQTYWQVLPINPTNYGDSPYQSSSVYAYYPYFIDFDMLKEMGLLRKCEYAKEFYGASDTDIDYAALFYAKNKVLKNTWKRHKLFDKEYQAFVKKNKSWIDGYALYETIKEHFGYTAWITWPEEYKLRKKDVIEKFAKKYQKEIECKKFIQFLFSYQWKALKKYANKKGVKIIGDMPIYVAYDSADVWANPKMFYLDKDLKPVKVAGCPPDAFTEDGQLWGNPLYRYDLMAKNNYRWWVKRIRKNLEMFDVVRIDHFRGFAGYFTIPFGDINAKGGTWVKGPGYDLFAAVKKALPKAQIIAENLGFLTDDVQELLDKCGYPGMQIFQFDYGNGFDYHPFKDGYNPNNIVYTGTHDNQTIQSWYEEQNPHVKYCLDKDFKIKDRSKAYLKLVEGVLNCVADTAIIPLQDYLGLHDDIGRMNIPSTLGCNWRYRCQKHDYNAKLAKYIYKITKRSSRL